MTKYRNIKIRVNESNSEAVQMKLFEDGCGWSPGFVNVAQKTKDKHLYIDSEGAIRYADSEDFFKKHNHKEITAQQILDPHYDIKTAWANGEALQFKVFDEWIDWIAKDELSLSAGDDWRVKPETKTVKQWERKYHVNGSVFTMLIADKDDNKEADSWIGEAYQAEYEVPND